MYQVLSEFLKTFSVASPILWTMLVVVVMVSAGLALYAFWEIVLKGLSAALGRSSHQRGDPHR